MRKVLVTGASGYIGSNLRKCLAAKGYDVYGLTSKSVQEAKMHRVDLTDAGKLFEVFVSVKPDVVIHAAGLSSLSECERNPELAMRVNVETTKSIIAALNKTGRTVKLVFLSSDYVFDGERGNYKEDDEVNPHTVYGKTKALSEADIKEHLEDYVICRTANVYGRGGNFFSFVLGALERNEPVEVFDDAFFTPTYIGYLLDSLRALIELDFKGVIHVAGRERLSRYDFALKMAETLGKEKSLIKPVKAVDKLMAKDSSLNCELSRKILRNYWPNVKESLHYCFGNLVQPYFNYSDQRGRIMGIFQGLKWEEINYVESIKGSVRGNHYHKNTVEGFFLIDGKVSVTLINLTNNSRRTFVAEKDNILIVSPYTVHVFKMIENSRWINLLSKPLIDNVKDVYEVVL
jgi:dTDP-4-dehydrorhamnose reductase